MNLAPINASPLQGRVRNWGRSLTVTNPDGDVVVEAAKIKAPDGPEMVFETAAGRWRIVQAGRSAVTVLDPIGKAVATVRGGEVALATGETLSWEKKGIPVRYRLGGNLWVAKDRWRSGRRFSAELSRTMLFRDDVSLLTGIAAVLTQHAAVRHVGYSI
jgi:hypothetical protein